MKEKILIVDDEWNMRNLLRIYLSNDYEVVEAKEGYEALQLVTAEAFDLVILDVMMPEINGWDVCMKIREASQVPILMLTARNELKDRVYGLEIGADDYLAKPFEPVEFKARVKALLRRMNQINDGKKSKISFSYNDDIFIKIDADSRQMFINEREIELTPKEFDLIYLLTSRPKRVFTREILLDLLWNTDEISDTRNVDTHIKNIRTKLKDQGINYNPIKTVWGVGYKFDFPPERS